MCIFLFSNNYSKEAYAVQQSDPISMYYFYNPKCEICQQVGPSVYEFAENHPDIIFIPYFVNFSNNSSVKDAGEFFLARNYTFSGVPSLIFQKAECRALITGTEITPNRMNDIYSRLADADQSCPNLDSNSDLDSLSFIVIYGVGFISGLSPCILLILGFISASYISSDQEKDDGDKNKNSSNIENNKQAAQSNPNISQSNQSNLILHLKFISGFILGTLLVYMLLSIAIIYSLDALSSWVFGTVVQYVFSGLLLLLGLWYIIDAWNENSKLFKTPESIKKMFRSIIQTKSMGTSFLLGIIFTMIKLPCIGAILMALLLNISADPVQYYPKLFVYFIGVLTPLLLISILLVFGLTTERLNLLRTKYRPALRLISGILIISIVLYSMLLS